MILWKYDASRRLLINFANVIFNFVEPLNLNFFFLFNSGSNQKYGNCNDGKMFQIHINTSCRKLLKLFSLFIWDWEMNSHHFPPKTRLLICWLRKWLEFKSLSLIKGYYNFSVENNNFLALLSLFYTLQSSKVEFVVQWTTYMIK